MTKTDATKAKREILAAQPGKRFDYLNLSASNIDIAFAGYMGSKHPEVPQGDHDSWAAGHAAAMAADAAAKRQG